MSGPLQFVHVRVPEGGHFGRQLLSDAHGSLGVGEEDGPEGHVVGSGGNKFEDVAPGPDPPHPDDRQLDRAPAGVDGGQRNRLERRPRVASEGGTERRLQRPLVQLEATDGVHEREPVRAGRFDRAGDLGDVPVGRGELRVKGQRGGRAAGGDDLMGRVCGFLDVRAGQVELDGSHIASSRAQVSA